MNLFFLLRAGIGESGEEGDGVGQFNHSGYAAHTRFVGRSAEALRHPNASERTDSGPLFHDGADVLAWPAGFESVLQ